MTIHCTRTYIHPTMHACAHPPTYSSIHTRHCIPPHTKRSAHGKSKRDGISLSWRINAPLMCPSDLVPAKLPAFYEVVVQVQIPQQWAAFKAFNPEKTIRTLQKIWNKNIVDIQGLHHQNPFPISGSELSSKPFYAVFLLACGVLLTGQILKTL